MDPYNHSTPISTKLPILDTGKFEQLKFTTNQYLQHKHYALWEVIEFGDYYKAPLKETAKDKGLAGKVSASTKKKGRTMAITAENIKYDSAKELWEAILKTFGGNEATKKTKKNQLKQQYGNFKAEGSETLEQTFNSLAPKWLVYTIVWRNKYDLDTMSLDDVYNNLKVYELEITKESRQREERESYKKDSKVEEPAPKAMIAIDDLDRLLGSQKLDKDMKGVGFNEYCVVPPPPAQVYSPPKKDPSWMGLLEFVDDTVTDYTRPTPSIDVSKSISKFDTKGDEGYFVGYFLSSIAFKEHSSTNISGIKEDVHQAIKEKESPLRFIALPNSFHEAQMATSNAAVTEDDTIPDNNAPQKEQEEVNGDKEVPESSGNSNPTASTKVSTNDSFELASSSTVETKVPTVSTHVPTGSLSVPPVTSRVPRIISRGGSRFPETLSLGNAMSFENRLEDFLRDTSDANVWVLVDCPNGVRPIGTKWVLKKKKDERGIVIKNKAQLVAQGHTLEEGIDYEEVFAPVARIEAIRLFLPYASYMGFTVYQMDVKSAFLYRTIDEEVYAMQPHGFQDPAFPHRVYKVEKVMYGLHQAPRAWYGTLSKYLLDNGFQRDDNVADLLTKAFDVGRFMYLVGGDSGNSANGLNRDPVLTFCDCHNVVAILEKIEHHTDFHQIVDFLEASHIRVETMDGETKILAKVNGRQMTVSESSIRRHLKLNDEEEPSIPSQSHSVITTPGRITRGTIRISQSKVPLPGVDETAFLTRHARYGEAFPTVTRLDAGQDRENIVVS
nr:putative ribonuclease H-like domain-containing protein [Tanacetum cinerariifolium]